MCCVRVIKRVNKRRIRLRESPRSRLRLKLKLGYKLPAEAYLYKYNSLFFQKKENNSDVRTTIGQG
jgi:hypothetical protein